MKRILFTVLQVLLLSSVLHAQAEKVLMDTPSPEKAREWLFALTEEPHVAGTAAEKKVADWVADRFKEFGLDVETVKYDVFLNHPKNVSLRMVLPREESISLVEDVYSRDKDSSPQGQFPAFHGYGASGKASGQIVYVNYGAKSPITPCRAGTFPALVRNTQCGV